MDVQGSLATLRHGFKCYGRTLYVAFFKAAHELNLELEARYAANRLGITRQLQYRRKEDAKESGDEAASVMRGDHPADGHAHDQAIPPAPAREKQEPVKRIVTALPETFRLSTTVASQRLIAPTATTGFRSFITLGAIRCDQDVGLYALVETYLI